MRYGADKNINGLPVSDFEAVTGKGVKGILEGKEVALGNEKLMKEINCSYQLRIEKSRLIQNKNLGKQFHICLKIIRQSVSSLSQIK